MGPSNEQGVQPVGEPRKSLRFGPWLLLAIALGPVGLGAALGAGGRDADSVQLAAAPPLEVVSPVCAGYADLAHAIYSDAHARMQALDLAIGELVAGPNDGTLEAARTAWRAARVPYLESEVFRFNGGPIDELETLINTWPIDESYIESPDGMGGLIGDEKRFPNLTEEVLRAENLKQGETSVSTGYHAIEFLLWGQDNDPNGPGHRSAGDFLQSTSVGKRRGAYLREASRLLLDELASLEAAWADGNNGNFRAQFLAEPPAQALGRIIKGMGILSRGELAGERLTVAYQTKDQENEHSCFSDNTHEDIVFDAVGIENICLGRYQRIDGTTLTRPSLCALIARTEPELATRLERQMAESVAAARAIPAPFDRAMLGKDSEPGRKAILRTITALKAQSDTLSEAVRHLGAQEQLASAAP